MAPAARKRRSKKPETKEDKKGFLPEVLDSTVIAVPLLRQMKAARKGTLFDVVIDVNLDFKGGRSAAWKRVRKRIDEIGGKRAKAARDRHVSENVTSQQYVFASLDADTIRELVRIDTDGGTASRTERAIYHVWPDFPLKRLTNRSISTVKADAVHNAFAAFGGEIVWAVIDSGIDGSHPHFATHGSLDLPGPLEHCDFTSGNRPLEDAFGHGTHVAGIIAGECIAQEDGKSAVRIEAAKLQRNEHGEQKRVPLKITSISGMAPRTKLLSLKVLDGEGRGSGSGKASSIIAALEYIQRLNGDGRRFLVHGVNLSVGYDFEPEWFACGQSPLCVEVNRLVKSGVVVVVAAGNSGYGFVDSPTADTSRVAAGLDLTINDPGNADLAITVGSTHRDMPHTYGVSYFSSKGPTGDGRMKPDLLAPGEKIISCDSEQREPQNAGRGRVAKYREDSGTSMAAPHVSGVIAAFLSIRREFIGRPEEVKRIFLSTATDLHRAPYFQGHGLVDVMRAIQSV